MRIFESAYLRLTAWYLVIIMAISVLFSTAIYQVSSRELDRGLRRQTITLRLLPSGNLSADSFREQQLHESKVRLIWHLFEFNIILLVAAGFVSYYFAKQTLEPIKEAHEAQRRFAGDASHELRTPLTAMKTEIEVALRDKDLTIAQVKSLLKSNLEEIDSLQSISENLLMLARYDEADQDLVKERCSVKGMVDEAIQLTAKQAKEKSIPVSAEIVDAYPWVHYESIVELLVVLLSNAIKYSEAEQPVTIIAHPEGKEVVIEVIDRGVGIPSEDLPYIFDRFYRADQSRSKQERTGYGLGLAIARAIVEKHHGTISATSEVNKGSIFTIRLPQA